MISNGVFTQLIEELKKLPGVGQKTAQRLAFFILKMPVQEAKAPGAAPAAARETPGAFFAG